MKKEKDFSHSDKRKPLDTWLRDDRKGVVELIDNASSLLMMGESILVQEKYGLSVVFNEETAEWEAADPQKRYVVRGNTPCAAISLWDMKREIEEESSSND